MMAITVWSLLILFGVGAITYSRSDGDIITTLNVVAWSFLAYMILKLVVMLFRMPKLVEYTIPDVSVPNIVDRENVPKLNNERQERGPITNLARALFQKISHAADEAAIYAFVQAKFSSLRRSTCERYSSITSHINVIGFEGIIGTLIGLITFMAQATVLFQFPDSDLGNSNSGEFIKTVTANLHKINLWTVSTAFFTSVIGWGAKAWIGQWVDHRMGKEMASISTIETWIQDKILARLTLPATVTTVLKFANIAELHEPLRRLVEQMGYAGAQMNEALESSAAHIGHTSTTIEDLYGELAPLLRDALERVSQIGTMHFDVQYVEGGIRLVPHTSSDDGGRKTRNEVRLR